MNDELKAALMHIGARMREARSHVPVHTSERMAMNHADTRARNLITAAFEAAPNPEEIALMRAVCGAVGSYIYDGENEALDTALYRWQKAIMDAYGNLTAWKEAHPHERRD